MTNPTDTVNNAINTLSADVPYAEEIRRVLTLAWVEAREDEDYCEEQGKPHLRTFLKTTPLGLSILRLAEAINEE